MKNSFILYYDLKEVFDYLTDEEAGQMIKAVMNYEVEGTEVCFDDRMLQSTFRRIADSLDRNKMKYERTCEARRAAAYKRLEEQDGYIS